MNRPSRLHHSDFSQPAPCEVLRLRNCPERLFVNEENRVALQALLLRFGETEVLVRFLSVELLRTGYPERRWSIISPALNNDLGLCRPEFQEVSERVAEKQGGHFPAR